MVEDSDYLVPNPESILREEDDGAFLFDPENGNLKYINEMGRDIYRMCNGSNSVSDIKSQITQDYPEIPAERIEKDIDRYLHDLAEMRFLKEKDTV